MTRARDVANLIGSGNYSSTTFTATAGQTAFTISHTQGFVQVFMNGLLLDETVDYTSNGSAVTLTSGAAAGDEIEVVAYNTFSVGDALNQAAADTRYVNTAGDSMTGNLTTTGNVGVGETSPNLGSSGTGLHIKGAASKDGVIKLDSQTADRSGIVQFTENGTDKWRIGYDATSNHLEFTRSGVADRMLISDDGYVTTPNQPHMLAQGFKERYGTTDRALFHTVTTNTGNHWNNTNGKFTCPVAGTYLVTAFSGYTEAQNYIGMGIGYNGSVLSYGWMHSVLNLHAQSSVTVMKNANANDYFYYFLNYGYTTPVDATGHEHHSHLSVYLLG